MKKDDERDENIDAYDNLCDFSNVIKTIKDNITIEHRPNQPDLFKKLFKRYSIDETSKDDTFVESSVSKYINGEIRIKDKVRKFYLTDKDKFMLEKDIQNNIFPIMADYSMTVKEIYNLLERDVSISETKREYLKNFYTEGSEDDEAVFLAEILRFTLERPFIKHDANKCILIKYGSMSPIIKNVIFNADVPKCYTPFYGRDKELEQLHNILLEQEKVFLHGIGGIGKTELAKYYAKVYKKLYTNIIYLSYEKDLKNTISNMTFYNDEPNDTEEILFKKHNRYLQTLNSDTLIIINNFNVTEEQDELLPVVMKYRCRILFTTRSRFDNYASLEITEIEDKETLLDLMTAYFPDGKNCKDILSQIIDTVHSHTLAVELAAKLLEKGMLEPKDLLNKLQAEKAALNSSEKIKIHKDEHNIKETYYGHIHILFSLYKLSEAEQNVMRNMSLMPLKGIDSRLFAKWLSLPEMNVINDLKEISFINSQGNYLIALHPLIQEISEADLKPNINNCKELCSSIQWICRHHGENVPYYKELFQIVENIINVVEKEDIDFYQRFLEDVLPYMEIYKYESGMQQIISEMAIILKRENIKTVNDVALYYDYKAACEDDANKALKFEKKALELLTEINISNAHLASNIYANLGGLYRTTGHLELAKEHMEKGIQILRENNLHTHDAIPQICNYAVCLNDMKRFNTSYKILTDLNSIMKSNSLDMNIDYAALQKILMSTCLALQKMDEAEKCYYKAMEIYVNVFKDDPEKLKEIKVEMIERFLQASTDIAQMYIS